MGYHGRSRIVFKGVITMKEEVIEDQRYFHGLAITQKMLIVNLKEVMSSYGDLLDETKKLFETFSDDDEK